MSRYPPNSSSPSLFMLLELLSAPTPLDDASFWSSDYFLFSSPLNFSFRFLFVFGYLLFFVLVTLLLLVPRPPFSLAFLSFSQFLWYLLFLFAATFRFSDFFLISSSLWFHLFFSRSIFFFDPRVLCSSLALARFLSPLMYFSLFTLFSAIFLLFAVSAAVHFLLHPSR